MNKKALNQRGFTLIELAMVLLVIGLIVGGVLVGRDLIRASELQQIPKEFEKYKGAILTFRDKYKALPGDFNRAGEIWGYADTSAADGTCAVPATDTGTGKQTCDGDGDFRIDEYSYETLRAWQHLENAGLIQGGYTGIDGPAGNAYDHIVGENCPESSIRKGGWGVMYRGIKTGGGGGWPAFDGSYGHVISIGLEDPGQSQEPNNELFTPLEAQSLEDKLDDGAPATGAWVVPRFRTTCIDSSVGAADSPGATDLDSVFELQNNDAACAFVVRKAF